MAHIIDSKKTDYATITLAQIGGSVVVSAFLLKSGEPDYDLGELCVKQTFGEELGRELFASVVRDVETLEATGALCNELYMRQLRDYAMRDRLGLIP